MDICVFSKYRVKFKVQGSSLNYEGDFEDYSDSYTQILSGGDLLDRIATILKDEEVISINEYFYNSLLLETFNPMTGEGSEYFYDFKEIKEQE